MKEVKTKNLLTKEEKRKLHYKGDFTLEALSLIDTYRKLACKPYVTSKKLNITYARLTKLLRHPYVRELFKLKLLEKGVTPDTMAEGIAKGIDAKNGIYYNGNKVNSEPNWMARNKFIQLAAEMFEAIKYDTKQEIINPSVTNIVVVRTDGSKLCFDSEARPGAGLLNEPR